MSFSVSFFARDIHTARSKLQDAYAPAAVKALIELALAGIPGDSQPNLNGAGSTQAFTVNSEQARAGNSPGPRTPKLCGILVETHGHIDERGGRSGINAFRVEPYYD